MISKRINKKEFQSAIRVGFDGDNGIYDLYCPHIKVQTVDDIVIDISSRIWNSAHEAVIKGVYEKNELIGYYVYESKTLVSFCINVKYRNRKYLKDLFSLIRRDLKGDWQSFLWTANQRAISWLVKNGMKIINQDHLITHLTY